MDELVAGRQDGAPQRRKPRADSFTPAKRQRFLDALALTCNVQRAAAHAGIDHTTAYYNRVRDAAFAEQWREALSVGYDRLEALLLEHGGAGVPLAPADPEKAAAEIDGTAPPPFDFERALRILQHYRKQRDGVPVKLAGRSGRASRAETNAALMKALAAAERRLERTRK